MMLLRRLLYLTALFLSVACVCVVAGEEQLQTSDGGACREPGSIGPKCEKDPKSPETSPSECADLSESERCNTNGDESDGECHQESKPCSPQKKPALTTPNKENPEGDRGTNGTVGAAGAAGAGTGAGSAASGPGGPGALPAVGDAVSPSSVPVASQGTKPVQGEADLSASAPGEITGGQTAVEDQAESTDNSKEVENATNADGAAEQPSSSNTTVTESTSGSDTSPTENGSTSAGTESTNTQSTDVGNTETSTTTTTTTTLPPELTNNKKGDADSSSSISSSVWVRVPLLIVTVLFSATVC
ncbi:uncharacterized protein TM35_000451310 [Trypanosoma theileri]|uniref:Uncharacterized protein n=1 Tax=Trypanosoma theileri TaxID=67003 RepID=A0A1X0NIU9_9TRYP|nr:uncharacterized protein TM35_000451310 [Trypanosoma theileri]ORC84393.1 hypothetical protein TM35_000451310 [Trypanosoma theileri]